MLRSCRAPDHPKETREHTEHQRYVGQPLGRIGDWREHIKVRQDDIVDQVGLQRNRGVLDHLVHPVGQPRRQWCLGTVGVQRRQLSQALCCHQKPPITETEAPLHQIREILLVRSAVPNKDGDADAGDHQQPEDRRRPTRVGQELDHIGNGFLGIGGLRRYMSSLPVMIRAGCADSGPAREAF